MKTLTPPCHGCGTCCINNGLIDVKPGVCRGFMCDYEPPEAVS